MRSIFSWDFWVQVALTVKASSRLGVAVRRSPNQRRSRIFCCRSAHTAAGLHKAGFVIANVPFQKIDVAAYVMTRSKTAPAVGRIDGIVLWRTINHFSTGAEHTIKHEKGMQQH